MSRRQTGGALQPLDAAPRQWRLDGALRLQAGRSGWLQVDHGRVWLTRDGGGGDVVLDAGAGLALGRGERVLVEPWRVGEVAGLAWALAEPAQPRRVPRRAAPGGGAEGLAGAALAWGLAAWARGLRGAAARLAAAARSAEARASRAQGCIAPGDSIASSGALQ